MAAPPEPRSGSRSGRRLEQLRVIQQLNEALGKATTTEQIYEHALDALWWTVEPDRAAVLLLDPDGVMRFKAWRGLSEAYRQATEGHSPWGPDTTDPQPVLVPDVVKEPTLQALAPTIRGEGIRALAFIPLASQERLVGKFMLYHDRVHAFTEQEVWVARVIGSHITFALEERRVGEELRFQKTLLELQSEASIDGTLVVSNDGRMISFNQRFGEMWGIPPDVLASRSDQAALAFVSEKLFDPEEFLARVAYLYEHTDEESREEIRLKDGRIFDRYSAPIRSEDGTHHGRAWFFRDVTAYRREEEEQRFLAQVSDVLASSLDHEATLAQVARLAVFGVADWCVIYVRNDDGSFRQLAVEQSDPSKEDLLRDLQGKFPMEIPGPVSEVLASKLPLLLPEIPDALLESVAGDEEQVAAIRAFGFRSAMIVPLVARETTLGAVALISAQSGRHYGGRDLAFAQELARRAATAVDNAMLHRAEQRARRAAQEAAARSTRLASVTAALSRAVTAAQVAEVVVNETASAFSADAGAVFLLEDNGSRFRLLASIGYPDDLTDSWRGFAADMPGPASDAIRSGEIVTVSTGQELAARWPGLAEMQARTGDEATVTAPLTVRGRPAGVLYLVFRRARTFTGEDRELFATLTRQCSQALDRASLYESEHQAAETLQRSLLPDRLPMIDGVTMGARYLPAGAGAQVGGDWYDLISLEGRVGLAVGDVEGRGITAASTMGQLRTALRAYALQGLPPGKILEQLNRFVHDLGRDQFATLAYILFDPATGVFSLASAGHPPPLVAGEEGATYLEAALSAPIGAAPDTVYEEVTGVLNPGETLVLYTDGLVDRRDIHLTDAMQTLQQAVSQPAQTVDELLDDILWALAVQEERSDDVALLAVRRAPVRNRLDLRLPATPHALAELRSELRSWLHDIGTDEDETQSILVACGEACTNAIEHPVAPAEVTMEVEAELMDGEIVLRVRDFGSWRQPSDTEERGWGIQLMEAFMDSVEVAPGSPRTVVTMRRRLHRSPLVGSGR